MLQSCPKCSRANPPEAAYCYFDGFVLAGHERRGGPLAAGARPFNSPFVFPSGRTCRNFDEIALACQEEWTTACGLLREGFLESFFGGLGRADLAHSARAAARFPDLERGLDQLLAELPTTALAEPKLRVGPAEINLGVLEGTQQRVFDLEIENIGGRLLYGTVTSPDSAWLTLGDGPGTSEKHFHITHDCHVRVCVHPDRVRASLKPVEVKLLVESNGGAATVVVRAEKPLRPFPAGPLGGATTPRQVAEMAQASPKEVAPLFENGEVQRWYASNGWTYPVKLPAASGVAAIQQFFEALGFSRAPKVDINTTELALSAGVGTEVPVSLEVSTAERRPVWAHAVSNAAWLEVGRPRYTSAKAVTLNMTVPSVPNRPGEVLEAEVTVIANGNQRFRVPVRLTVTGEALQVLGPIDEPRLSLEDDFPLPPPAPPPPPPPPPPSRDRLRSPATTKRRQRDATPWLMHLVPAVVLGLAVSGVIAYDLVVGRKDDRAIDPQAAVAGPNYDPAALRDPKPRIGVQFNADNRFGVVLMGVEHQKEKGRWKPLTARDDGSTNNTVVRIAGSDYIFGDTGVRSNHWSGLLRQALPRPYIGWRSEMEFSTEKIRVTQHVQVVPGQTSLLDTVLVYYTIRNVGTIPQRVGLRVMLDTFIGSNDGVPFTVPGLSGFVKEHIRLPNGQVKEVPDYIEAVENPDSPTDPGTIARLGLRGVRWGDLTIEEPGELVITRFPSANARWELESLPMAGDSCVALYWNEKELAPGRVRRLAFTYGLSKLDINNRLALRAPDSAIPGRDFYLTARVYDAKAGQEVSLDLPDGMALAGGEERTKKIAKDGPLEAVNWRVRAAREGRFSVAATSAGGRTTGEVRVQAGRLFGG